MRVLRERWLAEKRCNPNPGKESNEDFGREIVPTPNLADVGNRVKIANLLNKSDEEHLANNIKCDNPEITTENIISTTLPNNAPDFDQINTDMFNKSETDLIDIENISFFEMLHLSVPEVNEVQNSDGQIDVAAEKAALEKYHADICIENTLLEFWIAALHSKYPVLYYLPI